MDALSDRARDALDMRFREKQTRIKIADFLEITEHGAKNLMQRAKQQLRECVENKIQAEAI
jgi:RNA polymerase sigma-70 factor (ECF subfamily)